MTTANPPGPVNPEPPGTLDEAVAELRKARKANDELWERVTLVSDGEPRTGARGEAQRTWERLTADTRAEAKRVSMELGLAFLAAAAIERGLPPCCHGTRPEPGQGQS
jgi:hypothetical protein